MTFSKTDPAQWAGQYYDISPAALAERVKGWRRDRGISAADLAKFLGIPVRTLNGIEQGRGFSYPTMLARALDNINTIDETIYRAEGK